MNRLLIALALTPALFVTGAFAQTVTDDVTKQLWCGSAMVVAFSNPPVGVTEAQLAEAQGYVEGGTALIEQAAQAHLDAGYTQEALDKLKADLVLEVTAVINQTSGGDAKYTFEECLAILPATDTPAPADTSSSSAM
jgi:hypothetical protein